MNPNIRWLPVSGLILAAVISARAADKKVVCVENRTGVAASDLHVTFTGAGGNLYVAPLSVVAIGCPTPGVPSNGTVTDTAVIDWGSACVSPGASVMFIATTTNGPLDVVAASSFWTLNGTNIGPVTFCGGFPKPVSSPPPPIGPGALKIETWCAPDVDGFYLGCRKLPLGPCWEWWCCIPEGTYYWRVIWCPFGFPGLPRLFEFGPCVPLTGWMPDGGFAATYYWFRWTHPCPPPLPKAFPSNPSPTNGPPPFTPGRGGHPFRTQRYQIQVRNSEDGGTTFSQGGDFIQAFYDIYNNLEVRRSDTNNFSATWNGVLTEFAPRYAGAASALNLLLAELRYTATNPPNSAVSNLVLDFQALQSSFNSISSQFFAHNVNSPVPYTNAAIALYDASQRLTQLASQIPLSRLNDGAFSLNLIADAYAYASVVVGTGLVNTSAPQQDNLFWALQNRALYEWHLAASGMMTHMRVYLPLSGWLLSRSSIGQVRVRLQDRTTGEILEDFFVPLSDGNYFDVPYFGLTEGLSVALWFKLPTHLSQVINTTLQDGRQITVPSLIGGDANGDNRVDSLDLQRVQADLGTGGSNAVFVSSSDVSGDGYVNSQDLNIVSASQGQSGQNLAPPLINLSFDGSLFDLSYPFDFELEAADTLSPPNFTAFPLSPEVLGPRYHVSFPPGGNRQFFRAVSP